MRKIFNNNNKMWFIALLLVVSMAGCGRDHNGGGGSTDTTAPTVLSTIPVNHTTGMALNSTVNAIFSEAMSAATLTTTTFTVTQATTTVPGTVTYVGTTATFKPTGVLASNTTYTARITTGAKDLAGNALAANKVWSFTTGTALDNTAPFVNSTVPANLATGVALNGTVNATFSEAMSAPTITTGSFTVKHGSTAVSGTVTCVGITATFKPDSNLASSTTYTATIKGGIPGVVTDLAGNELAADYIWSFTTGTTTAASPAPVLLGLAGNYAIFADTGIDTSPGASDITGDIGTGPGVTSTAITGFALTLPAGSAFSTSAQVSGKVYAFDYAPPTPTNVNTASLNMGTAYTDAAGRTHGVGPFLNVGGGTVAGQTLAPGVYTWTSAVNITTDLTLSGSATDVWIFQVAGTLDMAAAKSVFLIGGALPKNVFWQVSGAVTIGANTHFEGDILGHTSITFGNSSSINGRLLSQTAVNLDATTVVQP